MNLQELTEKYGTGEYNLVLPNIVEADVPEYISFGVELVKLNPDPDNGNETYYLQKPWGGKPAVLGIARPGLEKIGVALGLRFPPEEQKRVDDGSDPMYCCWKAAAALAGLSGVVVRTAHYEIDLHVKADMKRNGYLLNPPSSHKDKWGWTKWSLAQVNPELAKEKRAKREKVGNAHYVDLPEKKQKEWIELKVKEYVLSIQDNLLVRCETGARLRVIREYSGLGQKFSPAEIKRPFAILKVVPRLPEAKTENERIALHKHLVSTFLGAYPHEDNDGLPSNQNHHLIGEGSEEVKHLPPSVGGEEDLAEDLDAEDIDVEDIPDEDEADKGEEAEEEAEEDEDDDLPFDTGGVEDFLGEVRSIAQKIVNDGLDNQGNVRDHIKGLIKEYGAVKLREVPADKYSEFLSRLEMPLKRQSLKEQKEREDEELAHGKPDESGAEETEQEPDDEGVSGKPWGDNAIIESRYQNFLKKDSAELKKWISGEMNRTRYDTEKDPAGMVANLEAASKAPDKKTEKEILAFASACLVYYGFLKHRAKNPYKG